MFLHSLYTFILSASPVVELRGAIPLGIVVYSLPVWLVLVLALIGNIIPPLFLIPIIGRLEGFLERHFPFCREFLSGYSKELEIIMKRSLSI